MEKRTTAGIDLAKVVFAVCVMDGAGQVIERQRLRRVPGVGSLPGIALHSR